MMAGCFEGYGSKPCFSFDPTAMEPPVDLDADSIRDEKVKVLRSLRPQAADLATSVIRGQYGPGIIDGKPVVGYRRKG